MQRLCCRPPNCGFKVLNPSGCDGGVEKMLQSRLPIQLPWTMDCLINEQSILLGMEIDHSTANTYTSATNLYLTFCKLHDIPIDPTSKTLSYYITFQSSHINPKSVESNHPVSAATLNLFPWKSTQTRITPLSSRHSKVPCIIMVNPQRANLP
jgi:hypothetical protein